MSVKDQPASHPMKTIRISSKPAVDNGAVDLRCSVGYVLLFVVVVVV